MITPRKKIFRHTVGLIKRLYPIRKQDKKTNHLIATVRVLSGEAKPIIENKRSIESTIQAKAKKYKKLPFNFIFFIKA